MRLVVVVNMVHPLPLVIGACYATAGPMKRRAMSLFGFAAQAKVLLTSSRIVHKVTNHAACLAALPGIQIRQRCGKLISHIYGLP